MLTGTHIFKTINIHMDEVPECKHSIQEIMKQALSDDNLGVGPLESQQPQQSITKRTSQDDKYDISI